MSDRRDPLEGVDRLLVDGTNLLHALRRGGASGGQRPPGGGGPPPAAAVVGRLRAAIPAGVGIEIVLDGPPDPGSGNVRVASGVIVRYAGRASADALLVRLVAEAAPGSIAEASNLLVVTDDNGLAAELRRRGARTARTAWLIRRLERVTAASPTVARPRLPPVPPPDDEDGVETRRWAPGRGATRKRGNPRRRRRRATFPDRADARMRP